MAIIILHTITSMAMTTMITIIQKILCMNTEITLNDRIKWTCVKKKSVGEMRVWPRQGHAYSRHRGSRWALCLGHLNTRWCRHLLSCPTRWWLNFYFLFDSDHLRNALVSQKMKCIKIIGKGWGGIIQHAVDDVNCNAGMRRHPTSAKYPSYDLHLTKP